MRIEVPFKNPKTNEITKVKVGWSWTLFFFSMWLGIPLFMRKLNVFGFMALAIWLANTLVQTLLSGDLAPITQVSFSLLVLAFMIIIGIKGNELTAKNYLDLGWTFAEPDSDATRFGKLRWGLNNLPSVKSVG